MHWRVSGEPSNSGGNEDCTEFGLLKKPLWNDNKCSIAQLSICEFVPKRCPTENPNYQIINSHCFFFESQELAFDAAQTNCGSKFSSGGQLFEPTSLYMNEKVFKIATEISSTGRKWVDVHYRDDQRNFKYASGLPMSVIPPWSASNPSNSGGNEHCVEFNKVGKAVWNDIRCDRKFMSVCESK